MSWGKPRRAGARPLAGPMTWDRKKAENRKPYPALGPPERLPARREPLRFFDNPERVATADYDWASR